MSAVNISSKKIKELFEKLKSGKITSVTTSTSGTQPTSYEQKVANLIKARYTIDQEIAFINNYNAYMLDNSLLEYKAEYEAYQAFRQECKEKAKAKKGE